MSNNVVVISDDLAMHAHFEVAAPSDTLISAFTGEEGLNVLAEHPCEVVFIDAELPDLSIQELLSRLPKPFFAHRIAMVGPRITGAQKVALMRSGIDDLMETQCLPFDISMALSRALVKRSFIARLEIESERARFGVLKIILKAFKSFIHTQRLLDEPVTMDHVAAHFPRADFSHLSLDTVVKAVENDSLSNLIHWRAPNILIVEDEPKLRDLCERLLKRKCNVVSVSSGEEALELLNAGNSFDSALVDIGLPGISGDVLVGKIKTLCPQLDVVMITAYESSELIVRCFKRGASDYLIKPYDPEEVLRKVLVNFETKLIAYAFDATLKKISREYESY